MSQNIVATVLSCGAGVKLLVFNAPPTGNWTLSRAVVISSIIGSYSVLYNGISLAPDPTLPSFYMDVGDGVNTAIDTGATYVYQLVTTSGTVISNQVTIASSLKIVGDVSISPTVAGNPETVSQFGFIFLFKQVLSNAINCLTLPIGWSKPSVLVSMPLTGQPTLPIITVNPDLMQETFVPIGTDVNTAGYGLQPDSYFIDSIVKRRYRVSILAMTAEEREYYVIILVAIFKSSLYDILSVYGQNLTQSFQSTSSQTVDPAFYFAELMLEFSGVFSVAVNESYPNTINDFALSVNGEQIA